MHQCYHNILMFCFCLKCLFLLCHTQFHLKKIMVWSTGYHIFYHMFFYHVFLLLCLNWALHFPMLNFLFQQEHNKITMNKKYIQIFFHGKNLDWVIRRARFTTSLCQHKPSFGVKIVLSGFTKDKQWWISTEKVWTRLFLCLTFL